MKNLIYTTIISVALCAACSHKEPATPPPPPPPEAPAPPPPPTSAQATLKAAKKQKVSGTLTFTQNGDKLKVEGTIEGLKKGPHGIHVHENGDCSAPDFASAGGHFNPDKKEHAAPTAADKHAGDLGNITADKKGKAVVNIEVAGTPLAGPAGIIGKAIIIHDKADDLKTQPTGNAGGRAACGVIEAK